MSARHWIVWLMLAMLPLRGWAVSTMEMPAAASGGAVIETQIAVDSHDRSSCHDGAGGQDASTGAHSCGLCDLCHNAVAATAAFDPFSLVTPESMPPPGAAHDTGRHAVGGLDRPPRRFHA